MQRENRGHIVHFIFTGARISEIAIEIPRTAIDTHRNSGKTSL